MSYINLKIFRENSLNFDKEESTEIFARRIT